MKKKILVAPLDWGLGHATRCIKIINELLARNCDISIASSGSALRLLQREFPSLTFHTLPGYDPQYPSTGSMVLKMAFQLPKFLRTIREEHTFIKKIVADQQIDFIISDNRYGCWVEHVPSVLITHQSNIMMPRRFGWLAGFVRKANERHMKNFSICWIPDTPGNFLSGSLSSFSKIRNITTQYIGALSRFRFAGEQSRKFDVVAVLSGPEPQRTIFEQLLSQQLRKSNYRYLIVRGLPNEQGQTESGVINFLATKELQQVLSAADVIIARSGYSTIMDLVALKKKAILVPTPGQTEQEYLSYHLQQKGIAFSMAQKDFEIQKAMRESKKFSGFGAIEMDDTLLKIALDELFKMGPQIKPERQ
jgi:uncharacterized protein (TIGR00661 family)